MALQLLPHRRHVHTQNSCDSTSPYRRDPALYSLARGLRTTLSVLQGDAGRLEGAVVHLHDPGRVREQQLDLRPSSLGRQNPSSVASGRTFSPDSWSSSQVWLCHSRKGRPSWRHSISWPKLADSMVG